ncbi:uncharacterized protein [Rhodnius prolixus]|uniref:uncharacterized protein n=1 Tax=Rhodnius prolixus TaxID=13249 RepID=UPI003D18F0F7
MVNLKVIHVYILIFGFYICQNCSKVRSQDTSSTPVPDVGPDGIKLENMPDFVCHAKYSCFPVNNELDKTLASIDMKEAEGIYQEEPTVFSAEQNTSKGIELYDIECILFIGPPIFNSTLNNEEVIIPIVEIVMF